MAPLSPMMQQYFEIKERHPDQILFFRLGDFYEMFFEDAVLASRELELVLTGRDCGQEERAPMCGVPYHSAENYIAKLIKKGYKVAICEQMEDPRQAKGVVKREVIRVITPGTLIESAMLEEGANNYILSVYYSGADFGLAFADISTGRVHLTFCQSDDLQQLKNELVKFNPSEIIFSPLFVSLTEMGGFIRERLTCCATLLEQEKYHLSDAQLLIDAQFGENTVDRYDLRDKQSSVLALGGLLQYLIETQKTGLERLVSLEVYGEERYMLLDATARRNLELTQTMRSGDKKGSLLWVLDKTKTAMGKRMLRRYLEQPLANPIHIEKRLNAVDELYGSTDRRCDLIDILASVFDMERLLTRIVCRATGPRELLSFCQTLERIPAILGSLEGVRSRLLLEIRQNIDPLADVVELITERIDADASNTTKDGWFIRSGFHRELDEYRKLLTDNKTVLTEIETKERESTGIKNLKVGYNKVFGYYIEITNSYKSMAPDTYIRKQTLSNCERYITEELKEIEYKILSAKEKSLELELELYNDLLFLISRETARIQMTADCLARLDVFCGFAQLAVDNNYCRPQITTSGELSIEEGRHPVVEALLGTGHFVPNDCRLDNADNRIAIITGPNMAGKSTYIRQVALIVLMAQIGCFVPAGNATIGVVDGIFTRVGASDDLATGQSTFMVEMNEVASILKNATSESLLILDEVGRGTSTFDGMSIAQAMLEYIADPKKLGAKTLFATHYHELTELETLLGCVKNYNTAVKKRGDDITFLRRIVPGAIDDSYGIEVSKLAGIPDWIIRRAHEILENLENNVDLKARRQPKQAVAAAEAQTALQASSAVEKVLRNLDPNTFTPLEALAKLYELKKLLG